MCANTITTVLLKVSVLILAVNCKVKNSVLEQLEFD